MGCAITHVPNNNDNNTSATPPPPPPPSREQLVLTGWQQSLRSSIARLRIPGSDFALAPPSSAPTWRA